MRAFLIAGLLWLFLAAPAIGASPLEFTRTTLGQASAIVASNQSHNEKLAALAALFRTFLDTDTMARDALGTHWSSFTPSQQKEFAELFRVLMERTYVQQLLLFEKPDFRYVGEKTLSGGASVDTKIVTANDEFDVLYQLRAAGEGWLVTKITVEGVSLTANLGSQLDRLLSRMSIDDLLVLMRQKYGNGAAA
jgi:ABC-type transporter MlaC component